MLARDLLSECCAKIFKRFQNLLKSEIFIGSHKTTETAFTRTRKLPFHHLVTFLIANLKGSYNRELDRFYQKLTDAKFGESEITKSAVTIARKWLSPTVFQSLNKEAIRLFEEEVPLHKWHDFRLLAIDGTSLRLPKINAIREHFGAHGKDGLGARPQARLSELHDVLNDLTIRATVSPYANSEAEQAKDLLLDIEDGDLLLLDRGYPSFFLFCLILGLGGHFCARLKTSWTCVRDFLSSGMPEQIVTLPAPASARNQLKESGQSDQSISLRLIRIELSSGEVEVLGTSLLDTSAYPHEEFGALYHKRWAIEEDYKTLKGPLEIENFTGKTVHSVYQDVHAQILAKNLTAMLVLDARNIVAQKSRILQSRGKQPRKINGARALSKVKEFLVLMFNSTVDELRDLISYLHSTFQQKTEALRPGRSFPRKQSIRKREFHSNQKRIA